MGIKYLLDSNVLSEPAKKQPNESVMQRLLEHDGKYATTAIVWHEMVYGCERLVVSKRKTELESYLAMLNANGLVVMPYDQSAAEYYAKERAQLQQKGQTCSYADGEIASIAVTQNLILVTRNTDDFNHFQGLRLENWFL
jgi:tRNA(fMet)-specific endonuclease VapC